jgi:hypothetical protein
MFQKLFKSNLPLDTPFNQIFEKNYGQLVLIDKYMQEEFGYVHNEDGVLSSTTGNEIIDGLNDYRVSTQDVSSDTEVSPMTAHDVISFWENTSEVNANYIKILEQDLKNAQKEQSVIMQTIAMLRGI